MLILTITKDISMLILGPCGFSLGKNRRYDPGLSVITGIIFLLVKFHQLFNSTNPLSSYELTQRRETLSRILWVVIALSIPLSVVNFAVEDPLMAVLFVGLIIAALSALYLNRKGHYQVAGVILVALIFLILNFDIYSAGGLISDAGLLGFPIVIIICSLLFGKRGMWIIAALCVLSIAALGFLDLSGLAYSTHYTDFSDVVVIITLTMGTTFLLWVIMHNADINLQRIKQDEHMLLISNELTLEGLAQALEYSDRETKNHSARVVEMSVRLAKAAGLQDEDLLNIKRGALLHDIGKLAIPDNILLKPGKLTDEEWVVMKTHPVKAMEILESIPLLKPAMNIPYCHHENWDGSGYPRGLKGMEIPLYARIFTIID